MHRSWPLLVLVGACTAFGAGDDGGDAGVASPRDPTPQDDAATGEASPAEHACATPPQIFAASFDGEPEGAVLDGWEQVIGDGALSLTLDAASSPPRAVAATGTSAYLRRSIAATRCIRCEAKVRLSASSGEVRYFGIERAPDGGGSFAEWDVAMNHKEGELMLLQYAYEPRSGGETFAYPTAPLPRMGEWLSVRLVVDLEQRRAELRVDEEVLAASLPGGVPPELVVYLGVRGRSGTSEHAAAFDDVACYAR